LKRAKTFEVVVPARSVPRPLLYLPLGRNAYVRIATHFEQVTTAVTDSRERARARASPHVESLGGDTAGQMTAMEWARYLAASFGTEGALDALQYYESVGWISPSVRRTMVDHVRGLPLDELEESPGGTDVDAEIDLDESVAPLADSPFERHAKSLEYVAAIAGDSLAGELQTIRLPETAGSRQSDGASAGDLDAGADGELGGEAVDAAEAGSAETESAGVPGSDGRSGVATESDGETDAAGGERVGVASAPDDADTYHLLAVDGARSLCGVLDADTPSAADVGEVLAREAAEDAGLSLCGHCRRADE
jgi:hypothetical protein